MSIRRKRIEPKKKQVKTKMPKRRINDEPLLPKQRMPGSDSRNRRINNLKRMDETKGQRFGKPLPGTKQKGPRKLGPRRLTR